MNRTESPSERSEYLQTLKKLATLRPRRYYRALCIDWTIIGCALLLCAHYPNIIVLLLCGFVIGNRQQALAVLAHESVHFLVHRNKTLNDLVGMVCCAWPLGSFLTGFRKFHLDHHKHVGTDKDPELKIYEFGNWRVPRSQSSSMRLILDLVGLGVRDLMQMMGLFVPTQKWELLGVFATWTTMAAAFWIAGVPWLILMWVIPMFTVFWALARFRIYTEHRGVQFTHRFQTNWMIRELFYPHGIGIHYEHHKWSFIPYYNLEAARTLDAEMPIVPLRSVLEFIKSGDRERYQEISKRQIMERDFTSETDIVPAMEPQSECGVIG